MEYFNLLKIIDHGSFGVVLLVNAKKDTNSYYALKCLRKDNVLNNNDIENAISEKDVCKIDHKSPYLINIYGTFQNEVNLLVI